METKEYRFYQDNEEEGFESFIAYEVSPDGKYRFEVKGTTRTLDQKDYYVTVFLNGDVTLEDMTLNPDPIVCRVSILSPKYLQYDRLMTKEEVKIFDRIMHEHWFDGVIHRLYSNYRLMYQLSDNPYLLMPLSYCPDYSSLETED